MESARSSVLLLEVPFDSGRQGQRMGAGPSALAAAGAAERLRRRGCAVEEQEIEPQSQWRSEVHTAFELQGQVASAVAGRHPHQLPLLLSGNCNTTLGVLAGVHRAGRRLGLVWFDAHGDFNTPDTDPGGFLDGQGLAMIVGRCWSAATSTVPGFEPLPEHHVLLVGARDLDPREKYALENSDVVVLAPSAARDGLATDGAITQFALEVDEVHLHIDLDVHDPSLAPANEYAVGGGLSAEDVQRIIRRLAVEVPVVSATLASYDPAWDVAQGMQETALQLLELIADLPGHRPEG